MKRHSPGHTTRHISRLDALPGDGTFGPRRSDTEGHVRMIDIQMAWDTVVATRDKGRGARRSVAARHDVAPSTVTMAISRFERAIGVDLFDRTAGSANLVLTDNGRAFARHGREFLQAYQILRKFVQDPRGLDVQDS